MAKEKSERKKTKVIGRIIGKMPTKIILNSKQINQDAMAKCTLCGSTKIETHDNEIVCKKCGYVIGFEDIEEFDTRNFNAKINRTTYDSGLSSYIDSSGKDATGKSIKDRRFSEKGYLFKFNSQLKKTSKERNLTIALKLLDILIQKLSLSDVIHDETIRLYTKAVNKKLIRGRTIRGMVAASIYAVTRQSPDTSKSLIEISRAANMKRKDLQSCYRLLHEKLPNAVKPGLPDPEQKLGKIFKGISISGLKAGLVERTARKILQDAKKTGVTAGKDPTGLAAAAIYLACKKHDIRKTQRTMAIAAELSEITLRNRANDLKKLVK